MTNKKPPVPMEKDAAYTSDADHELADVRVIEGLHRSLSNRQIQWIAIGGSIGTALFVSIAWGLREGGPGSLFIAFTLYSCFLALANSSMAEMTVFMPVVGGWTRMVCSVFTALGNRKLISPG
jgi:amino acid transporter